MIELDSITISAGSFVLRDVSLRVGSGEYAVLMGRTGCGKSTLLEVAAGLRSIQSGRVILACQDVTRLPPSQRGVGYVPQDLALFPTLTVREHLAFALHVRRMKIGTRVTELASFLGITDLLNRKPSGLSGGEAQRVALGRALSFRPPVLLLDEPLSALDEDTRGDTMELLKRVQKHEGVTVLHVTHARSEARILADCLFVIEAGKLVEKSSGGYESNLERGDHEDHIQLPRSTSPHGRTSE